MKKILVTMFLLVFGVCLTGCAHSTYGYQFHFYVDGGNGTISIETSSSFNPDVKMCKDTGDMCTLDCVEESYFVKLKGAENGSRETTFIATPSTGYQVKEWLFNGEVVEDNNTNSYTAIVTSEDDYVGVIAVRFEEIEDFEETEDKELLSFYNETMVINSVDGFPFIVTTDDLQTSQQLARVHERYNEEFFEHYALMIIAFDTCSTEEIIGINDIKFDGEKFIAIFDVSGVPITDDISTRHFVFKINKLAFENMDKPSYQVDIKVNNLDNIGSGSAYYDEYFTPIEDVVDKSYLYEYDGFGGEFTIDIYNDGTFMYYVGFFSSYIGRGNWEYTNGILTLTDVLDNPKFVNKFYVKDNYLIYIAEGSTNFMYLKVNDGAKFYVLYINKLAELTVVDNFNLLRKPLESYYMPGEEVEVIIQFLSGPRVGVIVNGNKIETTGEIVEGLGELFKFTMPNTDSIICITYNDIICNPDNDEHHKWDEGKHQQVPGGGHDELVYTCEYCGHHKYVEFTYEMQMEELATIVENEFNELNNEKIIIKDLIKMLEDILVEYNLTDTQTKEIEVCISVLEVIDEFDEITKEELEELFKNPDISDNIE